MPSNTNNQTQLRPKWPRSQPISIPCLNSHVVEKISLYNYNFNYTWNQHIDKIKINGKQNSNFDGADD